MKTGNLYRASWGVRSVVIATANTTRSVFNLEQANGAVQGRSRRHCILLSPTTRSAPTCHVTRQERTASARTAANESGVKCGCVTSLTHYQFPSKYLWHLSRYCHIMLCTCLMFTGETEDTVTIPPCQSEHIRCDVNWHVHGATGGCNPAAGTARPALQYQVILVDGIAIRMLLFPVRILLPALPFVARSGYRTTGGGLKSQPLIRKRHFSHTCY
jgi:hypothetical protein